VAPLDMLGER